GGERLRYLRVRGEGEGLGHLAGCRVGYLIGRGLRHACSRFHYGKGPVRQRYGSKEPSPRPIPPPRAGPGLWAQMIMSGKRNGLSLADLPRCDAEDAAQPFVAQALRSMG